MLYLAPVPVLVRVGNLDLAAMTQDWGRPHKDQSVEEHPLRVGGQTFAFGIGGHAGSRLDVNLGGKASRFTARIGVDDETGGKGTVVFRVYADGTLRYDSGVIRGGEAPRAVAVDLKGVKTLRLVTHSERVLLNAMVLVGTSPILRHRREIEVAHA
ncbi:hypothetical protein EON77_12290, partial [bacterium]